jgi:hypothetical protein
VCLRTCTSDTLQVSIVDVLQEAYPFAGDADVAKMLGWISSAKPSTTAVAVGGLTGSAAVSGSSSTKRLLPQHHLLQLAHADREEIVSTSYDFCDIIVCSVNHISSNTAAAVYCLVDTVNLTCDNQHVVLSFPVVAYSTLHTFVTANSMLCMCCYCCATDDTV